MTSKRFRESRFSSSAEYKNQNSETVLSPALRYPVNPPAEITNGLLRVLAQEGGAEAGMECIIFGWDGMY